MVLVLQAKPGNREVDHATLVRLQAVPLHQHSAYCIVKASRAMKYDQVRWLMRLT